MRRGELLSDQSNKWSDINERAFDHTAQTQTQAIAAQTAPAGSGAARLLNRALQTLWQTQLQMCQWSGAWSEVLFVGQSNRCTSDDGLRSPIDAGSSNAVPCQLPHHPRHPRSTVRNQPGVDASTRAVLGAGGECCCDPTHHHLRHCCRHHHGQYVGGLVARTGSLPKSTGGDCR